MRCRLSFVWHTISVSIIEFGVLVSINYKERIDVSIAHYLWKSCFFCISDWSLQNPSKGQFFRRFWYWYPFHLGSREKALFFEHSLRIWETRFSVPAIKTSVNRWKLGSHGYAGRNRRGHPRIEGGDRTIEYGNPTIEYRDSTIEYGAKIDTDGYFSRCSNLRKDRTVDRQAELNNRHQEWNNRQREQIDRSHHISAR